MYDIMLQQENLGFSVEELVPLNVREPLPEPASRQLPAHNGFGSLEDSAQNCISLVHAVESLHCILPSPLLLRALSMLLQSADILVDSCLDLTSTTIIDSTIES